MHIRRRYRTPNAVEVQEFNSAKCPGKEKPRAKKEKPTTEQVAKNNQKRKEREAGRMVDKYFNEDDLVLTLTWKEGQRPETVKGALDHFKKLVAYLRREYSKRFYELFWMRNVELGPKGGCHIHMIVNRIEGAEFLIKDWWRQHGGVYIQYLQDMHDQGKDIGEYIAKSKQSTKDKEKGKLVDSSWGHSRNIKKVPHEDVVISRQSMDKDPQVPKGWYLDKNSEYRGETIDGYPFRTYTIRRLVKKRIEHKMGPAQIRKLTAKKKPKKKGGTCRKQKTAKES